MIGRGVLLPVGCVWAKWKKRALRFPGSTRRENPTHSSSLKVRDDSSTTVKDKAVVLGYYSQTKTKPLVGTVKRIKHRSAGLGGRHGQRGIFTPKIKKDLGTGHIWSIGRKTGLPGVGK